ncbi:glycoside hydrolase Chb [Streptomyces sp. NPDC127166]|uniref:glycoside hydrolase Chb n=1 Tax=Streptomyces sp. NPDC127166 TaxID=3345380 RepID=UPI003634719A
MTAQVGTWTPAPTSYAYQWYANGRAISGATKATFVLTKAQRGLRITVRVTAYRTGHTAGVAWTRSTAAVAG